MSARPGFRRVPDPLSRTRRYRKFTARKPPLSPAIPRFNQVNEITLEALRGRVFSRTLLTAADGTHDTTSDVLWIQGHHLYCDLRSAAEGGVTAGFAGPLRAGPDGSDGVVEWVHDVDLDPHGAGAGDLGTFTRLESTLLAEHGHLEDYVEHWRIVAGPEVDPSTPVEEYAFDEPGTGSHGLLVRVGPHFGLARTGPASSDVSLGAVSGNSWTITRSSRPDHVGHDLAPVRTSHAMQFHDPDGGPGRPRITARTPDTPPPTAAESPRRTVLSSFDTIPTIDLSDLRSADVTERRRVADELGAAARNVGFAQIIGHGIDEATFAAMLDATRAFFALPVDQKMQVYIGDSTNHRGYVPIGEEVFAGATPDLKEAYDLSIDLPADHPDYLAGNPLLGPNQWPDLPDFAAHVDAYYQAVFDLGKLVLRAFALSLDLPEDRFDGVVTTPPSQLRLIHYPYDPSAQDRPGIGAHTDYEAFTLLRPTAPGLEVMNGDGTWIDVPFREDAIVLNTGDLLEILTNGAFVATTHRVRKVAQERYSFPLFFNFDYDTVVAPLPELVGDEGPRYQPVAAGEHLFAQTAQSFGYLRRRQEDGLIHLPTGSRPLGSLGREAHLA